jgi:hypothetical protein
MAGFEVTPEVPHGGRDSPIPRTSQAKKDASSSACIKSRTSSSSRTSTSVDWCEM